jgi:uncharacterized protein (DUF2336 family)
VASDEDPMESAGETGTTAPNDGPGRAASEAGAAAEGFLRRYLEEPGKSTPWDFSKNVCTIYRETPLSDGERALAEDILRQLAHSVELKVRQTMSEQLKDSPLLAHDIALQLAEDVESVALPILEYTEALSDEDLIAIIRSRGRAHQTAIAKRKQVAPEVSEALVATGDAVPVGTLLANEGAEIAAETYENVVKLFPESELVLESMATRPDLPIQVVEKLIDQVSDHLQFEIASRYAASAGTIEKLLGHGGEGATIAVLALYETLEDAESLAAQLHGRGRLTASLLLRALYHGQLDFVEFALMRRAQIELSQVRQQTADPLDPAFQRLYRRAQLPAVFFRLFRDVLEDLRDEIAGLAPSEDSGTAAQRRQISAIARRRDFDRGKFEAILMEHAANA